MATELQRNAIKAAEELYKELNSILTSPKDTVSELCFIALVGGIIVRHFAEWQPPCEERKA